MALAGIKGNSGSPASRGNKRGESQVSVSEMRWEQGDGEEEGREGGEASRTQGGVNKRRAGREERAERE